MRTLKIGLLALVLCYGCATSRPVVRPEPYVMTEARRKIIERLWQYRADMEHDKAQERANDAINR